MQPAYYAPENGGAMRIPKPDGEVIAESLGAPEAFGEIFDRHYDAIHAYLQRQLGPDRADDLASQTFLTAFDLRERFESGRDSARPWLYGIASNLCLRHYRDLRRGLRAYARTGVDPLFDAFDGTEERLDAAAARPALAAALAELPREEMQALLLHAWADLSYAEIADSLDVPIGTVRSRLHRARTRLREPIERTRESSPQSEALLATEGIDV